MNNNGLIPFFESTDVVNKANILKALGHPVRLKILATLHMGECNVKNIWESLELEQCVVSQHLNILKNIGAINGKRRGSEVLYSIGNPLVMRVVGAITQK